MEPGEKMGMGAMLLMGLCCGGLPVLLVTGPALAGVLAGSWPLLLAAGAAGGGIAAYRRHCRMCGSQEQRGTEVKP